MRPLRSFCLTACAYLISVGASFGFISPASAEQTADPYYCESILVGEYIGCNKDAKDWKDSVTFTTPPTAYFRIVEVLKGLPISTETVKTPFDPRIQIIYDFGDGEATQPKDWKFDESMLPELGSKWILFIPNAVRTGNLRAFETFDGSLGRIEFNRDNIEKVHVEVYLHQCFEHLKREFSQGTHLTAEVGYTLTRDGRVTNAHLIKKSQNLIFDEFALCAVNSMSGKSFLEFPEGSQSESIEKTAFLTNRLWYEDCSD